MAAQASQREPFSLKAAARSLGVPMLVSIAVHVVLLIIIGAVAWKMTVGAPKDFYLALDVTALSGAPVTTSLPKPLPKADPIKTSGASIPAEAAPTLPTNNTSLAHLTGETPVESPGLRAVNTGPTTTSSTAAAKGAIGVVMYGVKAEKARSVVYVVDASAIMISTLPNVKAKLMESIRQLSPSQRFGVILFNDRAGAPAGQKYQIFDADLSDATPASQARLADWLAGIHAEGRSNPVDGLRAAIAMKPQVVFLLSRSVERTGGGAWGDGLGPTLSELDRLNPSNLITAKRPTVIKTIQFAQDDPTGIMQEIAKVHGGGPEAYRLVKLDEAGGGK